MTIRATRATEASLNLTGAAIQVAATYEVHLTGSDLTGLAVHADQDGIPGVIVDALNQYLATGGAAPQKCQRCDCGACPGFWEECTCPTPKGGYTQTR